MKSKQIQTTEDSFCFALENHFAILNWTSLTTKIVFLYKFYSMRRISFQMYLIQHGKCNEIRINVTLKVDNFDEKIWKKISLLNWNDLNVYSIRSQKGGHSNFKASLDSLLIQWIDILCFFSSVLNTLMKWNYVYKKLNLVLVV